MKNINRILKQNFLWILFFVFALYAVWTRQDEHIFISQGPYSFGKYLSWLIFFGFFGYSFYSSKKENFFKSLSLITKKFWGRQIIADLYIGLLLPIIIIYLHGGVLVLIIWLIPILFYANLATLLYLALNYDSIIQYFIL